MTELTSEYTICMYVRLSHEDEYRVWRTESGSITAQRMLIKKYIAEHDEFKNCTVIERCDDGLSGKYFDNRPGFTDMIKLCKEGKINCIIVKDCSRFGRDHIELGDYLEQVLPVIGVRFISINDHFDSKTDAVDLDIIFKNYIYDYYARDLSKKALIMHRKAAEKGQYWSPQTVYGYVKKKDDKHKLEVDPEAAGIVREIFDRMLAGVSPTVIVKDLNERGVPTPLAYIHSKGRHTIRKDGFDKLFWDTKTIYDIVQNETYTGAVVSLKSTVNRQTGGRHKKDRSEWIIVRGMHEPIVSDEEYQTVQSMISKRNPSPSKISIPLYCGICGKKLVRPQRGNRYCKRGKLVKGSECKDVVIDEKEVAAIVLRELKEKLQGVCDRSDMILKKQTGGISIESQIRVAENSLHAAEQAKKMLFEKMVDREIDRETFLEKKAVYDEEIETLKSELSCLKTSDDKKADVQKKRNEAASFLDMTEMTDTMWEIFVKKVLVFPDKRIEIIFNYDWKIDIAA